MSAFGTKRHRLINVPKSLLDHHASMARVRNREEFSIDDPFNESIGAPNSRYVRSWIGITLGENPKNTRFAPLMLSLGRGALLGGISTSWAVR